MIDDSVIEWLLDSDPSIRWQVLRDLTDAPVEVVAAERALIATKGWGARMIASQEADGNWGGVTPGDHWRFNLYSLQLLREMGADTGAAPVQAAIARTRDRVTWGEEFGNSPFFEGETEPCINGRTLAAGAYFGEASDRLAERLLGEQLDDGGWNCEAPPSRRSSFHSTIAVLEGLLEYESARGHRPAVAEARRRGEEYLLERHLLRAQSTGEVIDDRWTRFSFPPRDGYDVLRALDHFRRAGGRPDPRLDEAVEIVRSRRGADGRWLLDDAPTSHLIVETGEVAGGPSRWTTLRALRVLRWAGAEG